jgi:hypothetical protein
MNKSNEKKPKYTFDEIVKVINSKYQYQQGLNATGYIAGMALDDDNVWTYGVYLFDFEEVWGFDEEDLQSEGNFLAEDSDYKRDFGSIRVSVNNGAGEVKASYKSYSEIEDAIADIQAAKASGFMMEAALISENVDDMYRLISMCIVSSNEVIKSSGYNTLWHLIRRFSDLISEEFIFNSLIVGLADKSTLVLDVVNSIMDELEKENFSLWSKIKGSAND